MRVSDFFNSGAIGSAVFWALGNIDGKNRIQFNLSLNEDRTRAKNATQK
jgi:hypothetical protein